VILGQSDSPGTEVPSMPRHIPTHGPRRVGANVGLGYRRPLLRVLSEPPPTTRLLQGYYEATRRSTTRLLPGYYQATTRLLRGYCQATTRLLAGAARAAWPAAQQQHSSSSMAVLLL